MNNYLLLFRSMFTTSALQGHISEQHNDKELKTFNQRLNSTRNKNFINYRKI